MSKKLSIDDIELGETYWHKATNDLLVAKKKTEDEDGNPMVLVTNQEDEEKEYYPNELTDESPSMYV
jgi:hypothetical protein